MGTNQRSQVTMTPEEIEAFLASQRTANLITLGASGHPHAIAMWFALIDGVIWFETKAKAQKAVNLRRDSRATVLVEDGLTYDTLRGVSLEVGARSSTTRRHCGRSASTCGSGTTAPTPRSSSRSSR